MSRYARRFSLASLVIVGCSVVIAAQSSTAPAKQRQHLMVVVSKGLPGIMLFDADTDEEICRATMKPAPHEAAFSRDGRTLYVPVYSPANVGQPGPNEHEIHFVAPTTDLRVLRG